MAYELGPRGARTRRRRRRVGRVVKTVVALGVLALIVRLWPTLMADDGTRYSFDMAAVCGDMRTGVRVEDRFCFETQTGPVSDQRARYLWTAYRYDGRFPAVGESVKDGLSGYRYISVDEGGVPPQGGVVSPEQVLRHRR